MSNFRQVDRHFSESVPRRSGTTSVKSSISSWFVSGYGTNVIAPAMPVIIQHNRTFLSLFGLAVNGNFHYPKYFTITPTGPDPAVSSTIGFFEVGEMHSRRYG